MNGNEIQRKPGPKNSGRKVVPEIGNHDEAIHVAAGQNAEVAKVDGLSGDCFEKAFVEQIEEFERQRFYALFTLCDETEIFAGAYVVGKRFDGVGWVFPIRIHDEDAIAIVVFGNGAKADSDSALVTYVDCQGDNFDSSEMMEIGQIGKDWQEIVKRAIVHGTDEYLEGEGLRCLIQLVQENTKRWPIVKDGDDQSQLIHGDLLLQGLMMLILRLD